MSEQPYCNYPDCKCPIDKETECLKGYPERGSMTAQSETPLTDISERLASASLRNAGFFSVGFCRVLDMQVLETALAESRAECERLRNQWLEACDEIIAQGHRAQAAESHEREAYERAD